MNLLVLFKCCHTEKQYLKATACSIEVKYLPTPIGQIHGRKNNKYSYLAVDSIHIFVNVFINLKKYNDMSSVGA